MIFLMKVCLFLFQWCWAWTNAVEDSFEENSA